MDTQGNLFNFYNDIGGERKITPVGNIGDLKSFKINELAGVKLDREINVVAFQVHVLCTQLAAWAIPFLIVHCSRDLGRAFKCTHRRFWCSIVSGCLAGAMLVAPQCFATSLSHTIPAVILQDGREIPLPPGTGFVDESGKVGPWILCFCFVQLNPCDSKWHGTRHAGAIDVKGCCMQHASIILI